MKRKLRITIEIPTILRKLRILLIITAFYFLYRHNPLWAFCFLGFFILNDLDDIEYTLLSKEDDSWINILRSRKNI